MCGIAGYVDPRGARRGDVERMTAAIRHRGPDGQGCLVRGPVGLGHRRLSIIDLEGGAQPMGNDDGSVWITFNGEIYNYRELRNEIEDEFSFRTHSDTEVILRLYEKYGTDCVKRLRGMFAFAISDERNGRLFIARDHLGQKPLYYFHDGERFGFGSEIKALLALQPALAEVDQNALYEYLSLRIITAPRSMFKGIRKLPAGHHLVFEGGAVHIERYWDLDFRTKHDLDFDALLDELDRRLAETVEYHLVSDVPVGAFLSGGVDSSLVVAMMSKAAGGGFKTFSGDVPYGDFSETPYSRLVAERYHTDARELTIAPSLVRTLPDLVWHLDEPSDPLSTCMYYISELARRDVKVVLGGDGGDELFGGYDRYYGNVYVALYAMIPEALRRTVLERLIKMMPEGYWYRSISHKLRWIHQMSFYSGGERYAKSLGYFYFSDRYRESLYTPEFRNAVAMFDPEESIKRHFDGANADDVVDRMLYTDSMTRMQDHPVMILDRMTMAHGLEARSPFMDHRLAEFCAAIPARFKVKGHKLRYVQIELARRYLPQQILDRKKQGFSSPLTYLLADEFRLLYGLLLHDSHLAQAGIVRNEAVELLLAEHLGRRADHGQRLWQLCNAEIWYRMYISGDGADALRELIASQAHQEGLA